MRIDQFMIMSGEAADRIDGVLLLVRPDGSILDANPAALDCYGYSRAQMLALSIHDIRAPGDQDTIDDQMRKAAEHGVLFEAVDRHSDGALFPVEVRSIPVSVDGEAALFSIVRDITERERAAKDLRESEDKFKYMFEDSIVAKSMTKPSGEVTVNRAFCDMLGYTLEEISDKATWEQFTCPDDVEATEKAVASILAGEIPSARFEKRYVRKDGGIVWADVSTSLRKDAQGEPEHFMTTIVDITEHKHAEDEILRLNTELEERVQERTEELDSSNEECQMTNEELSATNLKLEEATRAKSDFLASMSHELRTPLNSIIGFSGIMLQGLAGDLNEEQSKQLGMINNSGRHLLELINEVLDLAKVESGQDRPTIRKVGVGAVAREMFDTVGPMAEAKGIDMRWTCPEGLRLIRTDKLRIGQILLNLMGNAVKFTEHGYVSVAVSQDGSGVAIAVKDSGCGIAAEDLERVFDDFYQVSPHVSAKSEGTGLGLTVSRRLAESIGARIEVTSEPGRGSAFTLHIPERPRERDLPVGQSRIEL